MTNLIEAMKISVLFEGIKEEELKEITESGKVQVRQYGKDQFLIHQGDMAKGVGLVMEGRLHILREDFLGNREILAEVTAGDIFDEVYAILQGEPQSVAVAAAADSRVAFFAMEQLLASRSVMANMVKVLAGKNLFLTRKMSHLSRKTIREKLISYLSEEGSRQGSKDIRIPFNRQQLADYLSVERSALSRELSRMKDEGLIWFNKEHFLLQNIQ